MLSAIFKYALS